MQNIFRILMAVAATVLSALMAAGFSAAIAGSVFSADALLDLGTSNLAIERHVSDNQCETLVVSPTKLIVMGACFNQPEENFTYLEFEKGKLVYLRQHFMGKTVVEEKMRAFRALLGAPHEHKGTKTWSMGYDAYAFKYENDGWLLVKRRTAAVARLANEDC